MMISCCNLKDVVEAHPRMSEPKKVDRRTNVFSGWASPKRAQELII